MVTPMLVRKVLRPFWRRGNRPSCQPVHLRNHTLLCALAGYCARRF